MDDPKPETAAPEQPARPTQTIRLSAEELKALIAQESAAQGQKNPWDD